jgi:hypothetical protein
VRFPACLRPMTARTSSDYSRRRESLAASTRPWAFFRPAAARQFGRVLRQHRKRAGTSEPFLDPSPRTRRPRDRPGRSRQMVRPSAEKGRIPTSRVRQRSLGRDMNAVAPRQCRTPVPNRSSARHLCPVYPTRHRGHPVLSYGIKKRGKRSRVVPNVVRLADLLPSNVQCLIINP